MSCLSTIAPPTRTLHDHFSAQYVWVMPSSSARCAQLPRALDKVPFYSALHKFRDFLNGTIDYVSEEEMTFAHVKLKNFKKEDKSILIEEEDDEDDASKEVPENLTSPSEQPFAAPFSGVEGDQESQPPSLYFRPPGSY